MTSQERIRRMTEHREADRVPIVDSPWAGTISRWKREGMPADADWRDYFGVDKTETIQADTSPRYEAKVLEDTPEYSIYTSAWGVTMKEFKHEDSTPEFLDFKITTPEAWESAKARMAYSPDRINWDALKRNYPMWKKDGRWIYGSFWFGFDVAHSWMSGTETILIAMLEEPEWVRDVFETYLDSSIACFDAIWDAGYTFDAIQWYDDMGYKNTPFFSNATYRELLQPVHKRAVDWAHNHGCLAYLHSCGDIMPLIPDIVDTGVDMLNPIEVKAGMDLFKLKQEHGKRLTFHGGVDAMLFGNREATVARIEEMMPVVKENGGYIFGTDHSIPNSVDLETFRTIVEAARRFGAY